MIRTSCAPLPLASQRAAMRVPLPESSAVERGWCKSPVTVHLAGGDLAVELAGGRAVLTGPAEEICTVELATEFEL